MLSCSGKYICQCGRVAIQYVLKPFANDAFGAYEINNGFVTPLRCG